MQALVLIDIQNDYLPGGALAVPRGDEVVPVANRLTTMIDTVVATQDWHPPDHLSFASQHEGRNPGDVIELDGLEQILSPDHCVQHTHGADFAKLLDVEYIHRVFQKGTDRRIDSYSGFFDNGHRKSTGLDDYLKRHQITEVTIIGLALDHCVKHTALDAVKLGFTTRVVLEGCRAANFNDGDDRRAIDEMRQAGVEIVESMA